MKRIKNSIDVHTHAFHPKIAAKAIVQLAGHYGANMPFPGLADDLLLRLDEAGIERAFVHSAATRADQVLPANQWAIQLQQANERFFGFGTMHPDFADFEQELDRLEALGIIGIKLHPDFQGFRLNDPQMDPIYECIADRFVVMMHVGDVHPPDQNPSSPGKVADVLERFPKLTVIAAHFGGYKQWQYVLDSLAGSRVFLDTSSSLEFIEQGLLEQIFNAFPRRQLLFGSDYPMWEPLAERNRLQQRLGLSEVEMEELLTNGNQLLA